MADLGFPTVIGTATTNGTTATTTPALNIPTTRPAGSLCVVLGRFAAGGTTTWPSGWIGVRTAGVDASDDTQAFGYKMLDGSEGSTITLTGLTSGKFASVAYTIAGAESPSIQAIEQGSSEAFATGTTPNPASCTPTGGAKNYLWLWMGGWEGEEATSPPATAPTNYNNNWIGADSGTAGAVTTNCRVAMGWRQNNASSEDPGSVTIASEDWMAWTVAVHPRTVRPMLAVRRNFAGTPHPMASKNARPRYVRRTTRAYVTTLVAGANLVRNVTDAVTNSESLVRVFTGLRATTDAVTNSESLARVGTFLRAATDSETYSEAASAIRVLVRAVTDAVTNSEVVTRALSAVRATTDSWTSSNSVARVFSGVRAVTDSETYSEAASAIRVLVRAVTDAITNSESLARVFSGLRAPTDSKTHSESVARQGTFLRAPTDSETYGESVIASVFRLVVRAATDALTYAENLVRNGTFIRALTDSETYGESVVRLLNKVRNLTDSKTHSDSVQRSLSAVRTTSDTKDHSDVASRVASLVRGLSDSVTFGESVVRSVQGAIAQVYYRTADIASTLVVAVIRKVRLVGGEESPASIEVETPFTVGASHIVTRGGNYVAKPQDNTRTRATERSGVVPKVD